MLRWIEEAAGRPSAWVSLPQISLFESVEHVLVEDVRGRIAYTPGLVDLPTADAWFAELRDGLAWKAERRRMYEREVDVPRLTAHFRLDDGRRTRRRRRSSATRRSRLLSATSLRFNSVGLNFYRDGRDSVAPHNDHLYELVEGFPIALLSLGSVRRMTIRAKEPPRRVLHVDLEPGSLLLMSYETQLHYTHGIPKTKERRRARGSASRSA